MKRYLSTMVSIGAALALLFSAAAAPVTAGHVPGWRDDAPAPAVPGQLVLSCCTQ